MRNEIFRDIMLSELSVLIYPALSEVEKNRENTAGCPSWVFESLISALKIIFEEALASELYFFNLGYKLGLPEKYHALASLVDYCYHLLKVNGLHVVFDGWLAEAYGGHLVACTSNGTLPLYLPHEMFTEGGCSSGFLLCFDQRKRYRFISNHQRFLHTTFFLGKKQLEAESPHQALSQARQLHAQFVLAIAQLEQCHPRYWLARWLFSKTLRAVHCMGLYYAGRIKISIEHLINHTNPFNSAGFNMAIQNKMQLLVRLSALGLGAVDEMISELNIKIEKADLCREERPRLSVKASSHSAIARALIDIKKTGVGLDRLCAISEADERISRLSAGLDPLRAALFKSEEACRATKNQLLTTTGINVDLILGRSVTI